MTINCSNNNNKIKTTTTTTKTNFSNRNISGTGGAGGAGGSSSLKTSLSVLSNSFFLHFQRYRESTNNKSMFIDSYGNVGISSSSSSNPTSSSKSKAATAAASGSHVNSNYSIQSKLLLYVWFMLTVIFSILNLVCLAYPFWIGTTTTNAISITTTAAITTGRHNETNSSSEAMTSHHNRIQGVEVGLYKVCFKEKKQQQNELTAPMTTMMKCSGTWLDHTSILNGYFKISTYLLVVACLLGIGCVVFCFFIAFLLPRDILYFNASLQMSVAFLLLTACLVYPLGWSDPRIVEICGRSTSKYYLENCELKWTFILALVQLLSAFLLSLLAYSLAAHTDFNPDCHHHPNHHHHHHHHHDPDHQTIRMPPPSKNKPNKNVAAANIGDEDTLTTITASEPIHQPNHLLYHSPHIQMFKPDEQPTLHNYGFRFI